MPRETVLITGCSSGIGRATAEAFLAEDWQVYATARNPADIQTLGEREHCEIATLDVTDGTDVERVVSRIADEAGRIDCLVNNAGYAQFGPVEDLPVEEVRKQYEVNVFGVHRLTRAVLPHMRTVEDGTIVNLSSVAGVLAFPGGSAYSGSKFAVEGMSDALRNEVREFDIDVVLVEPGPVDTNFSERAANEVDETERSGAYDWFYDVMTDSEALGGGGPGAVSPEHVAADIVDAASSTKPPARIPSGPAAKVMVYGQYLPDWALDKLYGLFRRFV